MKSDDYMNKFHAVISNGSQEPEKMSKESYNASRFQKIKEQKLEDRSSDDQRYYEMFEPLDQLCQCFWNGQSVNFQNVKFSPYDSYINTKRSYLKRFGIVFMISLGIG